MSVTPVSAALTVPNPEDLVPVKALVPTRPLPESGSREWVTSERLLLRPFTAEDADALHVMRTQYAVMQFTLFGRIDADLAETQKSLARFLPPNDTATYNCAICLKETGELIGSGGCHKLEAEFGWPELGYMFRHEHWGKGYATEFVRAFLSIWDALPRSVREIKIDPRTMEGLAMVKGPDGEDLVPEQIVAVTAITNQASQNVLKKSGFEWVLTYIDEDMTVQGTGKTIELPTFRHFPGRGNK